MYYKNWIFEKKSYEKGLFEVILCKFWKEFYVYHEVAGNWRIWNNFFLDVKAEKMEKESKEQQSH